MQTSGKRIERSPQAYPAYFIQYGESMLGPRWWAKMDMHGAINCSRSRQVWLDWSCSIPQPYFPWCYKGLLDNKIRVVELFGDLAFFKEVRRHVQPVLIPSLSGINSLSRPLESHPDAQGTLWNQTEMHKGLKSLASVSDELNRWRHRLWNKKVPRGVEVGVES